MSAIPMNVAAGMLGLEPHVFIHMAKKFGMLEDNCTPTLDGELLNHFAESESVPGQVLITRDGLESFKTALRAAEAQGEEATCPPLVAWKLTQERVDMLGGALYKLEVLLNTAQSGLLAAENVAKLLVDLRAQTRAQGGGDPWPYQPFFPCFPDTVVPPPDGLSPEQEGE